jgi:autotransporter-associated beta strand protein
LYFAPEAGAFTISGNAIDFFAGKIENNSTNTQMLNLAGLSFNGGAQQINPIHGNITIGGSGNITNNGQRLEVFGVNGHTLTMEKNITGSGGVTLHGNSRLVITVDQSYTGGTVINGGTVQVGNGGTTGTLGTGNVTNNATLLVNRSNDITLSNAISGTGRLEINSGGTTTLAGINSYTGGTLVLGGVLFGASSGIQGNITNNSSVVFNQDSVTGAGTYAGAMSGTGSLTKQGGRILQLTGNNTYAGNTLVTGGELRVGNGGTAGTLGTGVVVMSNNATLSFNRANDFTLNNLITGAGTLTKLGAGTATLTASNAYTGSTIVSAGRLVINGQQSSATGVVTVNNGASLGGSGIIGGATTFLTGALHAPGNSPGVQTFNNGLLYSTGSVLEWELTANTTAGRGTSFDGINVNGGLLTIQSGAISTLVFNALGSTVDWRNDFWSTDQTWQVFDNSISPSLGTGSVFSTINLTADSLGATLGSIRLGATFAWDQQDNDLFLTYTAIPEPSAYMLLLLAGVSWVAVRLRKRRRVNP